MSQLPRKRSKILNSSEEIAGKHFFTAKEKKILEGKKKKVSEKDSEFWSTSTIESGVCIGDELIRKNLKRRSIGEEVRKRNNNRKDSKNYSGFQSHKDNGPSVNVRKKSAKKTQNLGSEGESTKCPRQCSKRKDAKNDSGFPSCSFNESIVIDRPKKKGLKRRSNGDEVKSQSWQTPTSTEINNMNVAQLLEVGENFEIARTGNYEAPSDFENSSDSGMSDLEEVQEVETREPVIPKEGVDITLEVPNLYHRSKTKKSVDLDAHLKRQINRVKKDIQLLIHKVHLLCWLAHLKFVNNILNASILMKSCNVLVTSKNLYPPKHADLTYLEGILKWFHKTITLKKGFKDSAYKGELLPDLTYQFEKKEAFSNKDYTLMFIILLRLVGLKARIVMSFQLVPIKPPTTELLDKKSPNVNDTHSLEKEKEKINIKEKNDHKNTLKNPETGKQKSKGNIKGTSKIQNCEKEAEGKGKRVGKKAVKGSVNNLSGSEDEDESEHFLSSAKTKKGNVRTKLGEINKSLVKNKNYSNTKGKIINKNTAAEDYKEDDDGDGDFKPESLSKKGSRKKGGKECDSASEENLANKKKESFDVWTEVYLEAEEKWISVDVSRQKIHCINELYSRATRPVLYIVACNNDSTLKDVTKRYVPNWHSDTRKKRVDEDWWNETMTPYLPARNAQDREEDEDINRQLSDKPLPAVISEYKDHPLYALKRHLLKFEGIYPPNAPTLGFVRGEPVYARECVVTLRSREIWYKEARVVRLKEEPYKIVKSRPKFDKMTGEIKKDLPLELFGMWQTEDYIPPIAVDGKVPRNEYGNVDLFKPCMLPKGTVHLQIPALNRVAKKLGIDCAPATVGFEFHSGGSHPVFDGFVVCEEFKEILLDAWNKEIDESAKKNEEKKEKRVYGNWKRLIRGLLIREKLKIKYAFGGNSDEELEKCNT